MMGVINITPNSFSDGEKNFSSDSMLNSVKKMKEQGCFIFDFGAQSTAPMNAPISSKLELQRFKDLFFPILSEKVFEGITFSIDTYRAETFEQVYLEIRKHYKDASIIWNDISGVLDEKLFETLTLCPDASYVFCHTAVRDRADSWNHLSFKVSEDITSHLNSEFDQAICKFKKRNFLSRLILDPCFGFSKDFNQNIELTRSLPNILESYSNYPFVIGISKKSFLRQIVEEQGSLDSYPDSEKLHAIMINHWAKHKTQKIIRVHNPITYNISLKTLSIMKEFVS